MTAEKRVYKTPLYIHWQQHALRFMAVTVFYAACWQGLYAQNGLVRFTYKKYPFIHSDRNEIVGAGNLDPFFEKLYQLKTQRNNRIEVLQIGDSHIQADFLSAQVRTDFQNEFGNGGRGVVVPLRVAGSNEPFNYKITSNVACSSKRCVFVDDPMPIGIGGVTITTTNENTTFHIKTFDYPPLNYAFNRITLFYRKDSTSFDFSVRDTTDRLLGTISSKKADTYINTSFVQLPSPTNDIVLRAEKTDSSQTNAMIFGLNLENDSTGIVYSAVGVNGAEAYQYARARYFAEQTKAIQPDLFIISLGTNEAQRRPFDKELVRGRIDSLVQQLRANNPSAAIVLTTPPDSYYRRKYYNPSVAAIHALFVEYAHANHLAVWDLFSATGGYKSCYQWRKYGLMRKDGVHFSRAGYELQGNMLYEAITKAYNNYVSHRRS
jgi:lysophospholipase L1-like esterase